MAGQQTKINEDLRASVVEHSDAVREALEKMAGGPQARSARYAVLDVLNSKVAPVLVDRMQQADEGTAANYHLASLWYEMHNSTLPPPGARGSAPYKAAHESLGRLQDVLVLCAAEQANVDEDEDEDDDDNGELAGQVAEAVAMELVAVLPKAVANEVVARLVAIGVGQPPPQPPPPPHPKFATLEELANADASAYTSTPQKRISFLQDADGCLAAHAQALTPALAVSIGHLVDTVYLAVNAETTVDQFTQIVRLRQSIVGRLQKVPAGAGQAQRGA